jgi:hypothetical protein
MDEIAMPSRPPFPCERFRFTIEVRGLMVLPPYKGGVLHGAMGDAVRRTVCATRAERCDDCMLTGGCLYAWIFDPKPPPGFAHSGRFQQPPRPYVLTPPLTSRQAFHPGETLDFDLVLMGRALDALPYFVHVFMELGRRGFGRERGRYRLLKVEVMRPGGLTPVYDGLSGALLALPPDEPTDPHPVTFGSPSSITIQLLTPLRLKEKGGLVTKLRFPLLFERLAQRIAILAAFHGPDPDGPPRPHPSAMEDLARQARDIRVADDGLHWYDWERYSGRQKEAMKFGGLRGTIRFEGDLAPFLTFLKWGELVHVGQGTTFGLGRLACSPSD